MSNCNPIHPDRKSIAKISVSRPIQLAPGERARRIAELRRLLHAPAFQARLRAEQGRDLP